MPVLRKVDGVTLRVPDLDSGLAFYVAHLGHRLVWRNDQIGQAGLAVPDSDEIILTTRHRSEPNWLVDDVAEAVERFSSGGGDVLTDAFDIPVGRVAVVRDPFGNSIVLVDLSRGLYTTDSQGNVTGVE
jgi:predicted enzyme related to lactoylglutathione lyase